MLMRLIDFLKVAADHGAVHQPDHRRRARWRATDVGISSLIDTWLLLRDIELGGERNRGMYILKSRGMAHSNQIREFLLTDQGIELIDVYPGAEPVPAGSAPDRLDIARSRKLETSASKKPDSPAPRRRGPRTRKKERR